MADPDDEKQLSQTVTTNDTVLSYMKRCAATSLRTGVPLIDSSGIGREGLGGGEGLVLTGPRWGGKSQVIYHIVSEALKDGSWQGGMHFYDCDKTFDAQRLQEMAGTALGTLTVYRPDSLQQLAETLVHSLVDPPKLVVVDGLNHLYALGAPRGHTPNIPSALQLLRNASATVIVAVGHCYHNTDTPLQPQHLAKSLIEDFPPSLLLLIKPEPRCMTSLEAKWDANTVVTKELQTAAFAITKTGIRVS
eukprot:TRINITY_DN8448_c0_g1_i1.p1 TRINITY_DN8448_c0_g1~~TRINITY_DN8448_c0_g1_i1.p1  ORF type:complete len:248 (+),score=75.08 TRINITY_DN8448_c0_g1_i1:650-1393(+)